MPRPRPAYLLWCVGSVHLVWKYGGVGGQHGGRHGLGVQGARLVTGTVPRLKIEYWLINI